MNARRKEKRQRAIRNRIILILALIVVILVVILLIKKLSGGEEAETTPVQTSEPASDDTTPPVINGAKDIEAVMGSAVSYMTGVTVTDDTDANPSLEVDNSLVDLSTPGTYDVTYIARDASGNEASVTVKLSVTAPPSDNGDATEQEISQMKYLAGLYLKKIVTDDMSDYEKAQRIWLWVNYNADYVSTSDKSNWVRGAIQFFDTHKGDCFNYFCAAKALLEECGIPTVDVVKSDTSHSMHFWSLVNLGDGWYHYDTTPRDGSGDYFFMVTDEQLDAYSAAHDNSHVFDHAAYPERATKIITDLDAQPDYYSFFKE